MNTQVMNKKSRSSLKDERGQTDNSLVTERSKTDDSFADHRKQSEINTNIKVKHARQGADEARDKSRRTADASSENGHADQVLVNQRERADAATESERLIVDEFIVLERQLSSEKSIKFLERERKETDQNLFRERTRTDVEVLATKAELTSRDEFLAIVSHDLKNPIGTILSYSDLLLDEDDENHKEIIRWARVIKRNAETALRLINDILDLERFAAGKLQLVKSLNSIDEVIRDSVESFSRSAADKDVSISIQASADKHILNCDRDRIAQVLSNLIGNALKFTPTGGSVKIHTRQVDNNLIIQVSDTGPGIADDQKKRIFERYAQIENKSRQGLGLGLYISTMLVEAHNGKLSIASKLGEGSTFSFSLPLPKI